MTKSFESVAQEHLAAIEKSFQGENLQILDKISKEILRAFKDGLKLLLCGNGGSAADAQHIAAEFIARFKRERRSLPAIALTTDTSILTAIGNDYGFEDVFSRQVEGLGNKGDVLIAISTSGNSKNVLKAVDQARRQGMVTVGFTGGTGGSLGSKVDLCFKAQSVKTPHVQEVHIAALHALSEVVEDGLFG
ncbi:MAG: SIS domain-containing protein [Candidatus Omnitrophica bacterium]|nr:SIS domain-containing protein [Candidatus Omnitrophota bacterium]